MPPPTRSGPSLPAAADRHADVGSSAAWRAPTSRPSRWRSSAGAWRSCSCGSYGPLRRDLGESSFGIGIACFNAFLYLGVHHTTASNAILMQAATPPMILIANFCCSAKRRSAAVGRLLSTLVLVVVRGDLQTPTRPTAIGDLFVLCGVVGWALYTALLRPAAGRPAQPARRDLRDRRTRHAAAGDRRARGGRAHRLAPIGAADTAPPC